VNETRSTSRLGIEQLTLLGMPPVDYLRLAAELGCAEVSMGLTGLPLVMFGIDDYQPWPQWSLRENPALRRETIAALRDTGVRVGLAEGFNARSDGDVGAYAPDLDIFAELGALRVNAICMESDMALAVDQLGKLADMAIARGMAFTVEFFPSEGINSFERALEVTGAIGRDKARVLLDAMHFFRTGGTLDKLRAAGTELIGYVQLADSPDVPPGESYFTDSILARSVPGEGELPLRELVAELPADLTISVEVPQLAAMRAAGPRAHAARVVEAARALGV
jgi:sugar phosphate isomerase/epimerase